MIKAVYDWIVAGLPLIDSSKFIKQSLKKTDPQEYILIMDTGGVPQGTWEFRESVMTVQIITQSVTDKRSSDLMLDVVSFIGERYGVILSDGSSDFRFQKIRAIDRPIPLGNDGEGFQYSVNYEFVIL